MKFKITGVPFVLGMVLYAFFTDGSYDLSVFAAIVFAILALTKQVKLI